MCIIAEDMEETYKEACSESKGKAHDVYISFLPTVARTLRPRKGCSAARSEVSQNFYPRIEGDFSHHPSQNPTPLPSDYLADMGKNIPIPR